MKFKKLIASVCLLGAFAVSALAQVPDTVNVGASPNDATGDNLREAFIKVNDNDQWLGEQNALVWDSITAHNLRLINLESGGVATWGGITGTLSDQTDLQDALDLKASQSALNDTASAIRSDFPSGGGWTPTGYESVSSIQTTITDTDASTPTSGAVVDYVASHGGSGSISPSAVDSIVRSGDNILLYDGTDVFSVTDTSEAIDLDARYLLAGDAKTLTAGSNITITEGTSTITIASTGGGEASDSSFATVQTDSISEYTADNGVTIEGIEMKDSTLVTASIKNALSPTLKPTLSVNRVSSFSIIESANTPIIDTTATAYTLRLTDNRSLILLTNSSAITVTVPPEADVAFDIGSEIEIGQESTGLVTIAEGSGVTVEGYGGLALAGQYDIRTLIKIASDTWRLK